MCERHKHRGFLHQVAINPPASKNNHQKSTQHGSTRQVLEFFSATKSWQSRPMIPRKTTCRSIRTPNEFAPNRDGRAMPESSATTESGTRSRPMHPIAMRVSMSDAAIFAILVDHVETVAMSPLLHYLFRQEIAPARARTGRRKTRAAIVVFASKDFERGPWSRCPPRPLDIPIVEFDGLFWIKLEEKDLAFPQLTHERVRSR